MTTPGPQALNKSKPLQPLDIKVTYYNVSYPESPWVQHTQASQIFGASHVKPRITSKTFGVFYFTGVECFFFPLTVGIIIICLTTCTST